MGAKERPNRTLREPSLDEILKRSLDKPEYVVAYKDKQFGYVFISDISNKLSVTLQWKARNGISQIRSILILQLHVLILLVM